MTQEKRFGEMNFGHAELGDKRRTKRLVKLADQMCLRPGGSLPQKLRSPADLHAFYRLMDKDDVTHQAILDAHRQATYRLVAKFLVDRWASCFPGQVLGKTRVVLDPFLDVD